MTFILATLDDRGQEIAATARSRHPTLLDLIQAVSEVPASEQETLATVADLINIGQVRLCGDAAGAIGKTPILTQVPMTDCRRSSKSASSIILSDVFQPSSLI